MGCKFILLVGNKTVSCKLLLLDDKFKKNIFINCKLYFTSWKFQTFILRIGSCNLRVESIRW